MPLKIYNTLTNRKEEFKTVKPGKAGMYVCGVTVYGEPHIGHIRSAAVFEMVRRYLEYVGYEVRFVRNVTDVDDKIIEKAREEKAEGRARGDLKEVVKEVAERYLKAYYEALEFFGIDRADVEPKATGHICDMTEVISALIKKGAAYNAGGDVYFRVRSFHEYGKLSNRSVEEMGAHSHLKQGEKKEDALDFALWKGVKEDEPDWESPWGKGRPGWHIECSVMSMKYLGAAFDIHGGGLDLIFPHHENEIAQSEVYVLGLSNSLRQSAGTRNFPSVGISLGSDFCSPPLAEPCPPSEIQGFRGLSPGNAQHFSGQKSLNAPQTAADYCSKRKKPVFASYWMHNGLLTINKEKMAKSLGNFVSVDEFREKYHPEVLKLFFLSAHYKSPIDFSYQRMEEVKKARSRFYILFDKIDDRCKSIVDCQQNTQLLAQEFRGDYKTRFKESMDDDFNTPEALSVLFDMVTDINSHFKGSEEKELVGAKNLLIELGRVLGLFRENWLKEELSKDIDEDIEKMIEERNEARKRKDFADADRIRAELLKKGIVLDDTPEGTVWRHN